ncbi:SCO family protein [Mesorhizobium sp. CO1-1-8]|uniref:SCO family protein n=1 Tax=Mesorhizobium sp. CO1-1-8 TaxID=2876631 RepID=UPI001CD09C56|nr:SCO family protein [Mesorhizobium sp. CO1-1-8]MBZ9772355.1 SCO family protein [Mesorhizobium sp. CO1-1-8]
MTSMEAEPRPARRIGSIVALACLAVVLLGIVAMVVWPRLVEKTVSPIGGPFTLRTQTGEMLSDADLRGKPFVIFFGFTRCPEVCPTTLWETTEALKGLGPEADKLRVLFVSIDPIRDTPKFMARYLQSFDKHITGLTGTEAEIAAVGKEYRIYYKRVPTDDGDYTMDHTATMFLMDADGQFVGTISYGEEMAMRLQKLRKLVGAAT